MTNVDLFLEHYGKKGMRWGVVNEELPSSKGTTSNKPLSKLQVHNLEVNTKQRNMAKARLAKSTIRMSELSKELDALNKGPLSLKSAIRKDDVRTELSAYKSQVKRDKKVAEKDPTTGMTATQKKVLIGASVAAAVGVAAIAYYNRDEIAGFARISANKSNYGDVFKRNEIFAKASTPEDVLKSVVKGANPEYNTFGGQMNCRRVTFAYEMRRRGYDVTATTSAVGRGQNETGLVNALIRGDRNRRSESSMSAFAMKGVDAVSSIRTRAAKGDNRVYEATTDALEFVGLRSARSTNAAAAAGKIAASLGSQPSGARGEIAFNMRQFIHSMQYEVFDGVPHIFDSQKAAHYPVTEAGLTALINKWGSPAGAAITRLDNLDLDVNFLSQWVK